MWRWFGGFDCTTRVMPRTALLYSAGRETFEWRFTSPDVETITSVDVQIDGTWHAATIATPGVASLMLAGPAATSNPGGTIVLTAGVHGLLVRVNDPGAAGGSEVIVRNGGTITVR